MTSKRRERRTRVGYVESGPKLVGNEASGLWGVQATSDEVHKYKEASAAFRQSRLRLPDGSSALKR
jgi:hypothetical protein